MFSDIIKKIALWLLKISGYKPVEKKQENIRDNEESKSFTKISIKNIKFLKKQSISIPKQIFFINVGDTKDYMNFCIDSFKNLNPSFKIEFLNYSKPEDFYKDKNVQYILQTDKNVDRNDINSVINILKYRLVYLYGGIYSDLHNYCIVPLKDLILDNNFITSILKNGNIFQYGYLFGVTKGYTENISNVIYPPIYIDNIDYQSMKMSFYNCNLKHEMFLTHNKKLQNYIMNFES